MGINLLKELTSVTSMILFLFQLKENSIQLLKTLVIQCILWLFSQVDLIDLYILKLKQRDILTLFCHQLYDSTDLLFLSCGKCT